MNNTGEGVGNSEHFTCQTEKITSTYRKQTVSGRKLNGWISDSNAAIRKYPLLPNAITSIYLDNSLSKKTLFMTHKPMSSIKLLAGIGILRGDKKCFYLRKSSTPSVGHW